jgi:hypothetical protein
MAYYQKSAVEMFFADMPLFKDFPVLLALDVRQV